jgi:hypothetical protein
VSRGLLRGVICGQTTGGQAESRGTNVGPRRRKRGSLCALFVDETTAVTYAYFARQAAKSGEKIVPGETGRELNALAMMKMKVNPSRACRKRPILVWAFTSSDVIATVA